MIFNMVSGGAALNFKIIGGTAQPENPAENTIWVNTDKKITDWSFAAAEPAAEEGMVWIRVGSASPAAFNALKNNGIMIYPISAKQYVSGAWVTKDAVSYQGGEWNAWIVYLFQSGDQNTEVTGGWSSSMADSNSWDLGGNYAPHPDNGGAISIGNAMVLNIRCNTNMRNGAAAVGTKGAIDLTQHNKIKAVCNVVQESADDQIIRLAVNPTLATPQHEPTAYVDIPIGASEVELDVSGISGLYHVVIGGRSGDTYGYDLTVSAVTVE